jgi:hypothetical protein
MNMLFVSSEKELFTLSKWRSFIAPRDEGRKIKHEYASIYTISASLSITVQ